MWMCSIIILCPWTKIVNEFILSRFIFVFMVEGIFKAYEQKLITTENEAIQLSGDSLGGTRSLMYSKTNGHSEYVPYYSYYIKIGSSSL